ncbi:MAG: response regulator [Acidobacteria bacterium]|nr:response regulator [Acidobacteriota bacterium]
MKNVEILVVEDEAIVAADLVARLRRLRYGVPAVVSSGEEALEQVPKTNPSLVLMDIKLAGELDGIEAARRIQTQFAIPVIYVTAHSDEATLARAKATGPYGYLIKPFDMDELRTTIEVALHKHEIDSKLKESAQWFATTLRAIGDGVITTDSQGLVTFMNPVAESLTGWKEAEALGKNLTEVFRAINEATGQPIDHQAANRLHSELPTNHLLDLTLLGRNGTQTAIEETVAPLRNDHGALMGLVLGFRDTGERKRAEEALRKAYDEMEMRVRQRTEELAQANSSLRAEIKQRQRLERCLLGISEQEQLRIGQDLHDGLGQRLTGIAFLSKALEQKLQEQSLPEAADTGRLTDLLNEVISQTKELARGLHPVETDPSGLMTALRRWADHITSVFGLSCCFECPDPVMIADNGMATQLYRIAQEAAHNAVKHARASRMIIGLGSADGQIVLTVQDNGAGFSRELEAAQGMGLQIMRHRAEAIGAALNIQSSPSDGTRVTCSIPASSGNPASKMSAQA